MKDKRFLKIANSAQIVLMLVGLLISLVGCSVSVLLTKDYTQSIIYTIIFIGAFLGMKFLFKERKEI